MKTISENTNTHRTSGTLERVSPAAADYFIGIDYHKRYSICAVLDAAGQERELCRIDHAVPEGFGHLLQRWPRARVAFECSMNWHWLYELLEEHIAATAISLANPHKTRVIAEAQVKTDKVDARILAHLLRADLLCLVHIPEKQTRQRKEVLRQRCFFVRQRTAVRNRIHRLLGGQHDLVVPQCSDLFGKRGMKFLEELELAAPEDLLLKQQLEMLRGLQQRIKEDEAWLAGHMPAARGYAHVLSLPGMGPILSSLVVSEIDDISRFASAQKLSGYCGLCPSTSSSGGKTYQGRLLRACNKWLRWAFVEASWLAIGLDGYFGNLYRCKRALGKKPNTAIVCVARRMARITWQLLTQKRPYDKVRCNPKTSEQAGAPLPKTRSALPVSQKPAAPEPAPPTAPRKPATNKPTPKSEKRRQKRFPQPLR